MINHVRNTVLTALNKENRGYLTPEQFNLYAKHAQQLLFDQYFGEYSKLVALKNARRLSSEYGDKLNALRSNIETFLVESDIPQTTGYYVKPDNMYQPISLRYGTKELDMVPKNKEMYLYSSNLTAPSENFPVYVDKNNYYYIKPDTLTSDMTLVYVRNVADPKWTYDMVADNPIFNPSAGDYKDFELAPEDEPNLVLEILKLAGLTIREPDITQAALALDSAEFQKENA
jgi:hypothetical protein